MPSRENSLSHVVLSDKLFKLYYQFHRLGITTDLENKNNTSKRLLIKLLSSLQTFCTNQAQLIRIGFEKSMIEGFEPTSMPLLVQIYRDDESLDKLVLKSKLKLLLISKHDECTDPDILTYNILNDKQCGFYYTKTFNVNDDKTFAINHINKLIADSTKVDIVDAYFFADETQATENINLLQQMNFNPSAVVHIYCYKDYCENQYSISENLTSILKCKNIIYEDFPKRAHDRHLATSEVKIRLPNGIYSLTQKNKEVTYAIEVITPESKTVRL